MKYLLKTFLFILSCSTFSCFSYNDDSKLELVQVIFRHGDRLPQKNEIYKTDPYEPEKYKSLGYGQLTKVGTIRSYKFGLVLRQRYDAFLGNYRFNKVYAYSTNYDRTKISLQAVLGGLYSTKFNDLCENNTVILAPIPTYYDKTEENFLVKNIWGDCPKYARLKRKAEQSREIQNRHKKYADFYEYLKNVTGYDNNDILNDATALFNNVQAVTSMNLTRPNWCSTEDFEKLKKITTIAYDARSLTRSLKRIIVGPLIEKLLSNIENNNANRDDGRKIYLYSTHDTVLGAFTRTHDFENIPDIPEYADGVIIEKLKGKDNQVYLQMFYWIGSTEEMIPLKLGNIGFKVPLDTYKKIVKRILPQANDCV